MSRRQKAIYRRFICRIFDFIVSMDPVAKTRQF